MDKRYRKNEQIRGVSRVMLVGQAGEKPQVLPFDVALRLAYDKELDLVEIGPNQVPPVVKVMDYGAFLYHENKKAQENAKKNKELEVKEVRFRPVTDDGDLHTKIRQITGFLEKGHKVRLSIKFKGREFANVDAGFKMVERVLESVKAVSLVESPAKMDGKQLLCILAPSGKKSAVKEMVAESEVTDVVSKKEVKVPVSAE